MSFDRILQHPLEIVGQKLLLEVGMPLEERTIQISVARLDVYRQREAAHVHHPTAPHAELFCI